MPGLLLDEAVAAQGPLCMAIRLQHGGSMYGGQLRMEAYSALHGHTPPPPHAHPHLHCNPAQSALLAAAAARVKPGGLLVYSTCSIEAEENGERVAAFLAAHPDFAPEPPPAAAGIPPECLTPEGYLQMLPHVHDTDGAFAARLRRRVA